MDDQQLLGNPVKDLAKRFLITFLLGVVVYRLGIVVPVPGVSVQALEDVVGDGGFLGYLNMFNGGAISNASIFGLGVLPYISASIIMQLLAVSLPALKALQKEGEVGRRKINQYTRYLTVGICLLQAGMAAAALTNWTTPKLVTMESSGLFILQSMVVITCGSMVLLWLAEQISKFGVGNGVSVIIMIGIISRFPAGIQALFQSTAQGAGLQQVLEVALIFFAIIAVMVCLSTARRRINLEQQRRVQGNRVYGGGQTQLPLMLNQANVIPVIFAQPIMAVLGYLGGAAMLIGLLGPGQAFYRYLQVALIVFFTYFYISITFDLGDMANHFKQSGFFIRGIRPGKNTVDYIKWRLDRITFVGAFALAFVAVAPPLVGRMLALPDTVTYSLLAGISLLIVVGVSLDVIQKVMSYLLAHQYQGAMGQQFKAGKGGGKGGGPMAAMGGRGKRGKRF